MINIVSFNGGRGARNLIPTLLDLNGVNLTSIVNAYDDGKSTGEIRAFFRMLGPSDIRKVQEAMVPRDLPDYESIVRAFEFRYKESVDHDATLDELKLFGEGSKDDLVGITFQDEDIRESLRVLMTKLVQGIGLIEKAENKKMNFADCSIMNLAYAGAYLHFGGNFEEATIYIDKLFKLRGTVLPTNNEDKKLVAIREDGTVLFSEAEIVELRSNVRLKRIYLMDSYPDRSIVSKLSEQEIFDYFELMNREVSITPKVMRSISDADIIIYSPGTQHSSLYPSYMTKGLTEAIANNKKALKIFITNIGEDYETPSYTATDYVKGALKYLAMGADFEVAVKDLISYALVNTGFSGNSPENYVKYDEAELKQLGCNLILEDLEDPAKPGRHNGTLLAKIILDLYNNNYLNLKKTIGG